MVLTSAVQVQRRLFTVVEYEQMVLAGVFDEDDRLELIEGELMTMSPIGSAHAGLVNRLNRLLLVQAGVRAILAVQNPIRLSRSEPRPDLALLRPRPDDYTGSHPEPADVLVVIEVADATVDYDREVKIQLYARGGIVEAWLVDINRGVIEAYREPNDAGYGEKRTYAAGDRLSVRALPDIVIAVHEVFAAPNPAV